MQDPSIVILIVALTFLLAGMVKGVIGMGLPTVAMGLLGLVMPPVEAAALLVVPSLVTNVWQLVAGPRFIALLRRFATLMVGVCLGTAVGIGLLTGGSATFATVALGAVLAAYGAIGLISARFTVSPRLEHWLSPLIGVITGFLTGATGVFVIPAVPYFNSLGLEKEELIQTLGLSFTVSTLARPWPHGKRPVSGVCREQLSIGAASRPWRYVPRAGRSESVKARRVSPLVLRRAARSGRVHGWACVK